MFNIALKELLAPLEPVCIGETTIRIDLYTRKNFLSFIKNIQATVEKTEYFANLKG
jgi:hypothetical protein